MAQSLEVVVSDGFAFAHGGDTAVIVYKSPARLKRIRWIFDRIEELAARTAPINGLLIVLESSDLPDAATRAENTRRMVELRGRLRRVVTVVLGDSMRVSLVRTIMRAMFLLQGMSRVQHIVSSVEEGLNTLLDDPTAQMPKRPELRATLTEIARRLECTID
jgi:hypothetical protein